MDKTIYETDRGSYNRSGWKNRKKRMRKMGMNRGEWHTMSNDEWNQGELRDGMIVKNASGRPTLYRVIIDYGRILLEHMKTGKIKHIDNPDSYKWVSG